MGPLCALQGNCGNPVTIRLPARETMPTPAAPLQIRAKPEPGMSVPIPLASSIQPNSFKISWL